MHRKAMSTTHQHAALTTFVRKQLGVEHRDDVGPWLGQAAWLEELHDAPSATERSSRRKVAVASGDLPKLVRRTARQVSKHATHKR